MHGILSDSLAWAWAVWGLGLIGFRDLANSLDLRPVMVAILRRPLAKARNKDTTQEHNTKTEHEKRMGHKDTT